MTSDLTNLQTLLYRAIVASPGGVAYVSEGGIGIGLERMIRGGERRSALECITIYADAYFHRLFDCLKEDFPATLAVVGEAEFRELVRSYLVEYPPAEPSIFHAGRDLADFLEVHHFRKRWPFLSELARLERTIIEVFHGPDAQTLTADEMRSIAPGDWPGLILRIIPALTILDCQWRVSEVLRAVETGTECIEPESGSAFLLVWRQDAEVYYRELELPERKALEVASRGAQFAKVCEAFALWLDGEDPTAAINRALTRWFSDGLIMRA